jgi:spectinomycin phosphotransferase
MGEQPKIPEKRLRACLQEHYDLSPVTLEFLPRGHDYNAGVYRVVNKQGASYLLKATSRPLYEPSCLVPGYLNRHGITSVIAPIPTLSNVLWTKLENWTVIVYPFIDGDTSLTGMTNEQWKQTGAVFKQIHQVPLAAEGFESLRKETFDPTAYIRRIRDFDAQHLAARLGGRDASRALRASWLAHQPTIHAALNSLERPAAVLRSRPVPYVICHADLHPANLLRARAGHVYVIDWDEVMLAPKERDFIFLREPRTDAFWEGYGQKELDWIALTYYRWERIVQDLIENAGHVCFSDDLAEETKVELVEAFNAGLAEDGAHISAAYAAAAHIPKDLTTHTRKNF